METLVGLFAFLVVAALSLAIPIVAIVALVRANQAVRELAEVKARLAALARHEAEPAPAPTPPPAVRGTTPPAQLPPPAAAAIPLPPIRVDAPRAALGTDFATQLGPQILVGACGSWRAATGRSARA